MSMSVIDAEAHAASWRMASTTVGMVPTASTHECVHTRLSLRSSRKIHVFGARSFLSGPFYILFF